MRVRELLSMDICIDVCDDYNEECSIAFCGSVGLTEIGKDVFTDVLELPIRIINVGTSCPTAIVYCENSRQSRGAAQLFRSLAGFCTVEEWEMWFNEEVSR